jgi:DNA topoisomerase-1
VGEGQDGKKPKRVSLPEGSDPDSVDLEYALKLLALPRALGSDPTTGKEVTAGLGRYGPYVQRGGTYRNLRNVDQLFQVSLEEALELLSASQGRATLRELGAHPQSGEEMKVLDGRYGPYVTDGSVNASLPKGSDPEDITVEEAVELLAKAALRKKSKKKSKGGGGRRRKSS